MKLNEQVLELINNSEGHLSAEDAFLLAKQQGLKISFASMYRVLSKLVSEGKIRKIKNLKDVEIYDKTTCDHEHLVCSKCGKITDIKIKDFMKYLEKATGENIDSYDLCINYVCKRCKKK